MLLYLLRETIFNRPEKNCIRKTPPQSWRGLPKDKSLFHADGSCGLPIGNLTSQLLALNYLDELDHLINGEWGVKHYGRCGSADGWGKIGAVDGGIFDAGNLGAYWAAAPWKSSISSGTETYGGAHFCFSVGQYQVSSDGVANTMSRDFGLSVRCVRISQ